jgi:RNA polymerase sigma-70 factor, ECF subfamily
MDRDARGQPRSVKVRPLVTEDGPAMPGRPTFPELFSEYSGYVWTALRRLGAKDSDLEDLTHDVFIRVFAHLGEYDPTRPIKPWLFGFAFRIASEDRRRIRRRPQLVAQTAEPPDPNPGPIEQLLARERRQLAWAALETLELDRRAVFILHELDGCPIPEVAESLGIPLATGYSRLRLAREDFDQAARRIRSTQR